MKWLIYKHGSNEYNQLMTASLPVAIVEADSKEEATETAPRGASSIRAPVYLVLVLDDSVIIWANQYVTAVAQEEADADDWNSIAWVGLKKD